MARKYFKLPHRPKPPPSGLGLQCRLPLHMRKQIFLPYFKIALIRTPFLSPRWASFYVPLHFNKLDMRDYLRRLYGVETLRIRSYVEQQKVTRLDRSGKGLGPLRRPLSKKKMTVEMTEPFVWPDPPEDMSPWEQDRFFKTQKYEKDYRQKSQPDSAMEPDTEARKAYEAAAKEMKETKEKKTWSPTWQALGLNYNPVDLAKRFGGGPKS